METVDDFGHHVINGVLDVPNVFGEDFENWVDEPLNDETFVDMIPGVGNDAEPFTILDNPFCLANCKLWS